MRIEPISFLTPIMPIETRKKRKKPKEPVKNLIVISDDNLGKNVDITIDGPFTAPNCYNCISYYITLDPDFPHGCKVFNLKRWDKDLPSWGVYEATRCHCRSFKRNPS
jgi:hypothetical protein